MKNTTVIFIIVLVFIVIGVVVYMFINSNKDATQITRSTTSSGLGNLFANSNGGVISALLGSGKSNTTTPKIVTPAPASDPKGQAIQQDIFNNTPLFF